MSNSSSSFPNDNEKKNYYTPKPIAGEHKRGALGNEEKLTIQRMCEAGNAISEICTALNRNPEPIIKYIKKNNLVVAGTDESTVERTNLKNKLMGRHYWNDVKLQFNEAAGELDSFIESWISYMMQFGEDTTYSEELQIKDIITCDILIGRSMQERNLAIQYIATLQKQLDKLVRADDLGLKDQILEIETQINMVRASLTEYTNEYAKLLDKKKDLNKDLKGTRDQRVKKIEDSITTFGNYIKALDDEDSRKRTGEQIELMRVAKDRAKRKLGGRHIFGDGRGDLPFLTPELYKEHLKNQKELEDEDRQKDAAENPENQKGEDTK